MIRYAGFDANGADVERRFFEFLDFDVGRDFFQTDRKKGAFHLAGQNVCKAVSRAFVAKDAKAILFLIDGEKKGKALYVIPMSVRQEKGEFHWGIVKLGQELPAQWTQASAAVEDDDLAVSPNFDAGRVATITDSGWAGSWNGAADAPES